MKRQSSSLSSVSPQAIAQSFETLTEIASQWRRHKVPTMLFLALCFNLVLAPVVYAASGNQLSRPQSWSLALLGLGTAALAVYLFFVMFAPEKF